MTIESRINEIRDSLKTAKADASESHKEAMNSYGAGYDAGRVAGLEVALETLLGAAQG